MNLRTAILPHIIFDFREILESQIYSNCHWMRVSITLIHVHRTRYVEPHTHLFESVKRFLQTSSVNRCVCFLSACLTSTSRYQSNYVTKKFINTKTQMTTIKLTNEMMMIAEFPFSLYIHLRSLFIGFMLQHFKRQNQKLELPHQPISWKIHKIQRRKKLRYARLEAKTPQAVRAAHLCVWNKQKCEFVPNRLVACVSPCLVLLHILFIRQSSSFSFRFIHRL